MKTIAHINTLPLVKKVYAKHNTLLHQKRSERRNFEIHDQELKHTCNKYGLTISIALVSFFILMRSFHLHQLVALRYFNFVFLMIGIALALSSNKKRNKGKTINYHTGLKMGLQISLMAIVPFAIFMLGYLYADSNFMNYIKFYIGPEDFLNPVIITTILLAEGLSFGIIITIVALYFHRKEEKAHQNM